MPKRKSFCDGRRRSRSIGGYATNGFSELIDPSLPPDERLKKLLKHTFEHCLLVGKQEFSVNDDYEERGIECWRKIKAEIDNTALCSEAVSENTVTEDFSCAKALKNCNDAIQRYEAESMKWNALTATFRKELTKAVETTPSNIDSDMDINEPLFDYTNVIKEQTSIPRDIHKQTKVMLERSKMLSTCLKVNKCFRDQLFIKATALLDLNRLDTPKRMIRQIVINDKQCYKFKK